MAWLREPPSECSDSWKPWMYISASGCRGWVGEGKGGGGRVSKRQTVLPCRGGPWTFWPARRGDECRHEAKRTLGEPLVSTVSASGMRDEAHTSSPPAVVASSGPLPAPPSAAEEGAGRFGYGRQKVLWRKQRRQGRPPSPVGVVGRIGG